MPVVFTFSELPGQRSTAVADLSPHRLAHGTTLPASCLKTFTWLLAETLTLGIPAGMALTLSVILSGHDEINFCQQSE